MTNYAMRQAIIASARKLNEFDLHEGEMVKTKNASGIMEYYRVSKIYPFIFTAINIDNGLVTSFPKGDAVIGVVKRCQ